MAGRIEEVTNVKRVRETVAPQIIIDWNPVDNSGTVSFCLRDMIWEDDVFIGFEGHKLIKATNAGGSIQVKIPDIMAADIPLNGTTFSGMLLMGLIKSYFNMAFDAALDRQNNPPPVPEMDVPTDEESAPLIDPDQLPLL